MCRLFLGRRPVAVFGVHTPSREAAMKPEDRSTVRGLVSGCASLRSRNPEESKLKDWRDKTERKLEEVFGKESEQLGRFKSLKFFDFSKRAPGLPKDAPLGEDERARYLKGVEDARHLLQRLADS
jgi:hypothetical protein